MENRDRRCRFLVSMNEKEMDSLMKKVRKTGLSREAYVRKVLAGVQPREQPPADFLEVLKTLRQISINMNQIAMKANTIGFIDAEVYWKNSRRLQDAISDIKHLTV